MAARGAYGCDGDHDRRVEEQRRDEDHEDVVGEHEAEEDGGDTERRQAQRAHEEDAHGHREHVLQQPHPRLPAAQEPAEGDAEGAGEGERVGVGDGERLRRALGVWKERQDEVARRERRVSPYDERVYRDRGGRGRGGEEEEAVEQEEDDVEAGAEQQVEDDEEGGGKGKEGHSGASVEGRLLDLSGRQRARATHLAILLVVSRRGEVGREGGRPDTYEPYQRGRAVPEAATLALVLREPHLAPRDEGTTSTASAGSALAF